MPLKCPVHPSLSSIWKSISCSHALKSAPSARLTSVVVQDQHLFYFPAQQKSEASKTGLTSVVSSPIPGPLGTSVCPAFHLVSHLLPHFEHKGQYVPWFLTKVSRHLMVQPMPGSGSCFPSPALLQFFPHWIQSPTPVQDLNMICIGGGWSLPSC